MGLTSRQPYAILKIVKEREMIVLRPEIEVLLAIKKDLFKHMEWLKGEHVSQNVYIIDFFARHHKQFEDTEETIALYRPFVSELFNEYVY